MASKSVGELGKSWGLFFLIINFCSVLKLLNVFNLLVKFGIWKIYKCIHSGHHKYENKNLIDTYNAHFRQILHDI